MFLTLISEEDASSSSMFQFYQEEDSSSSSMFQFYQFYYSPDSMSQ